MAHLSKKRKKPFASSSCSQVELNQMSIEDKSNMIAEISESVLEDPSACFFSTKQNENDDDTNANIVGKQPSKVRKLLDLADKSCISQGESKNDGNEVDKYISRLAIISLLAIFQDILPSYRIRLPTSEETSVKVTKETRKVWQYERALLQHYQMFLKILERTWEQENKKNVSAPSSLAITAIVSLAELLKIAPHFNFRSDILNIVIRQANNKKCDQVANSCCNAITYVFLNDPQGEISLEATKSLSKMIYSRKFQVRPEVLNTFLSLPLRVHADEAEAAKIAQKAQNKKRKRNATLAEESQIESEIRDYSGSIDKIALAKNQADTLHDVILTYFRILKTDPKENSNVVALLPGSLQGLAKFSHLIHFDAVLDLLKVLRKLLESIDALPVEAALNAILTAFQTLQGPGRELQIDHKEYVTPLYTQLTRLSSCDSSTAFPTALQCLTLAFLRRREYSTTRIASFLKQILTSAMHTETHISIPLVAFARQLLQRYPASTNQLLENEADTITSGSYTPDVQDPEHSNAFATSAWELGLLKFHFDPIMGKRHAQSCAENRALQMPLESPDRIFEDRFKFNVEKGYIGCKIRCKKHPFRHSLGKDKDSENKKKGRNREQFKFVKARKTTGMHLLHFDQLC